MQEAYEITAANTKKSAEKSKRNHDRKVRSSVLHEGDRVLVRNLTPRGGTGKLRNHWEDCIHKVIRQVGKDMPIYEVISEQGKARGRRILHRNLLLPCDHLPLEIQLKPTKAKRQITARTRKGKEQQHQESDVEDSDEDDYGYSPPRDQFLPVIQPEVDTDSQDADKEYEQLSQDAEPQQQDICQLEQDSGDTLTERDASGQQEITAQEDTALEEGTSIVQSPVQSGTPVDMNSYTSDQ
ncbi:hypothetical protein DPEC_G00109180 [Dallia pectoralis]|nr:hypothetical protein DPEC_G00109180 [Dallia pectoralis]